MHYGQCDTFYFYFSIHFFLSIHKINNSTKIISSIISPLGFLQRELKSYVYYKLSSLAFLLERQKRRIFSRPKSIGIAIKMLITRIKKKTKFKDMLITRFYFMCIYMYLRIIFGMHRSVDGYKLYYPAISNWFICSNHMFRVGNIAKYMYMSLFMHKYAEIDNQTETHIHTIP